MLKYVCVRAGTVADFDLRVMNITLSSHLFCFINDLQRLFIKVILKFHLRIGTFFRNDWLSSSTKSIK